MDTPITVHDLRDAEIDFRGDDGDRRKRRQPSDS
jgi:hypothetical protein